MTTKTDTPIDGLEAFSQEVKSAAEKRAEAQAQQDRNTEWELSRRVKTEPNTGRSVHVGHAGGGRSAVFSAAGEFLLEIEPAFLDELCGVFRSNEIAWSQASPEFKARPPQKHEYGTCRGLLDGAGVDALASSALRRRCLAAGIDTRLGKGGARSITQLRLDLKRHYDRLAQASADRAVLRRFDEREKEFSDKLALIEKVYRLDVRAKEAEVARDKRAVGEGVRERDRQARTILELTACIDRLSIEAEQADEKLASIQEETAMDTDTETQEIAPTNALAPVGDMLAQAAKLAAMQRGSKVFAQRVGELAVRSGMPSELVADPRVQKLLGLVVPLLVSQYGDKIPGLRNVAQIQPLAQQKIVMDVADVLDITMGDLWGVLGDVTRALNEGTDPAVEQLPAD